MEHNSRRYFKSLEELSNPTSVNEKEFLPETPGKNVVDEAEFDLTSNRRDFLKFMGFSISAATLAACTKTPVKKAIPYVIKPHEVDPGVPNYYASYYPQGGYGVLVKTREGRPIKIEGNNLDPLSLGGTSAAGQASVLSLYDQGRLHGPMKDGEATTWEALDKDIYKSLRTISASGGDVAILTNGIDSPSTLAAIDTFKQTHRSARHVAFDPISYSGIRKAYNSILGKSIIPRHDFSKAKTIVSFGADFLGTWLSPVAFTKQYSVVRDVTAQQEMAYHVQFESTMSLSGSKADLRIPTKPSEQGAALVAVYNALAAKSGNTKLGSTGEFNSFLTQEKINHVAEELWANRSNSIVICGSNDINQQAICLRINEMLSNYGHTLDTNISCNLYTGDEEKMTQLVGDMNAGRIKALIIFGANPSYNYAKASAFNEGLAKVDLTISLSDRMDETSGHCQYVAPNHHWLESWNDFNPLSNQYNLSQPCIQPIFDTRQAQESILFWANKPGSYYDFIKSIWESNAGVNGRAFETFWKKSLHDGLYVVGRAHSVASAKVNTNHTAESTAVVAGTSTNDESSESSTLTQSSDVHTEEIVTKEKVGLFKAVKEVAKGENSVGGAIKDVFKGRNDTTTITTELLSGSNETLAATNSDSTSYDTYEETVAPVFSSSGSIDMASVSSRLISDKNNASGTEVSLYQKTGIMDGQFSNNPWLLELPDSISKVSWDNYACVSPVEAQKNNWVDGDLISVSANGVTVENIPVLLQPGQLSGTISIALGYGRAMEAEAGRVANGVGVNVYSLVGTEGQLDYNMAGTITKTGSGYELAKTQTHHHIQIPTGLGKQDRPSTARRKADIVRETSLGTLVAYRNGKKHSSEESHVAHDAHGHGKKNVDKVYAERKADEPDKYKDLNIYPDWKDERNYYKAIHWGLTVNLNTCTGCNACVIACQSENNIPVVGKKEVMRRRELHWIRIDRYFATADRMEEDKPLLYSDNPSVMFQPLMCQHCDNAPCENVCPVNAINHSSEGINQQIYNRCMGTRYCANNCPYKVRRFNWFAYYDNDKFNYNFTMNSDLGRMVLNPDVTVRARGVMEKCSFCMQRIQAAKVVAKSENRGIVDGDVVTACQQSCPADAIQFGNMNDPESKVSKVIEGDLSYRLVELLNTNNSVYYTTQVRNVKLESELPETTSSEEHHNEEVH